MLFKAKIQKLVKPSNQETKLKAHGQKLLVIFRYAVTLPGIDAEVKEIWQNVRDSYNVITRRDLIKVSCILSQYADRVEDGLLVEPDRAMYSADNEFNQK